MNYNNKKDKRTENKNRTSQTKNSQPREKKTGEKRQERPNTQSVSRYKLTDFLPTTKKEVELRKWDELDIILFSGDAYIDHPAFGAAVIGRTLEAAGYKVASRPSKRRHRIFHIALREELVLKI